MAHGLGSSSEHFLALTEQSEANSGASGLPQFVPYQQFMEQLLVSNNPVPYQHYAELPQVLDAAQAQCVAA